MCDEIELKEVNRKLDQVLNLRGFYSGYATAEKLPKRLTDIDIPCRFVQIAIWNTEDDGEDTIMPPDTGLAPTFVASFYEIYYGFNNQCVHQLFPGETTLLIPICNARDVFIRRSRQRNKDTRVFYSLFK